MFILIGYNSILAKLLFVHIAYKLILQITQLMAHPAFYCPIRAISHTFSPDLYWLSDNS